MTGIVTRSGGSPSDDDDDDRLARVAQSGDRDALEQLLRNNYDRMYAVCRRMTGDDTDAADATQEALIAVVRGLPRFDGRSRFTTWAYRIAVNASIDELRRRRRRAATSLDELGENAVPRIGSGEPESAGTRADVDAALLRVPVEYRGPVVLRDLCGLDYAEIAEVLEIPEGTVKSRISRGRSTLAGLLGPARSEA